ncbi:MAG: hypothetical protein JNL92_24430 [Opitutaceae bacterium]|nr:hypothetical protein [Opitutaceae bacterium]
MNTKSLLPILVVPVLILLIPAGAMLFKVEGWAWGPGSFVVAWMLLTGVGLTFKFVTKNSVSAAFRIASGIALATGLLLVWINAAVGFIGSEDNPANLMYGGVLLIGAVGAVLARFEPLGMARALFATAVAQFLVPLVALLFWPSDFSPGFARVFGLNTVFALLFASAGILFRHSAGWSGAPDREGATG